MDGMEQEGNPLGISVQTAHGTFRLTDKERIEFDNIT